MLLFEQAGRISFCLFNDQQNDIATGIFVATIYVLLQN